MSPVIEVMVCCHQNLHVGQLIYEDFEPICHLCKDYQYQLNHELREVRGRQAFRKIKRKYPLAFEIYYWIENNCAIGSEEYEEERVLQDLEDFGQYLQERLK